MSDNLILPSNYKKEIVLPAGYKKVWEPIAESQKLALSCPAQIILLQGTRASGKTDVSLMRFRRFVGIGYGEFWRGIVYDVSYRALDDIVNRAKRWFSRFNDGSKFYASKSDYKYVWKTGEELLFRSISTKEDYENSLHGQELCLHIDELVDIEDKGLISIRGVEEGDKILTPSGYKSITKVFPIRKKSCNLVSVYSREGNLIGKQIQSTDHRLLGVKGTWDKVAEKHPVALMTSKWGQMNYPHPYDPQVLLKSDCKFEIGYIEFEPIEGRLHTIDITVADVNCYVNPLTRTVSKNCFISPNELTKHPTSEVFDLVLSTNRSSFIPEDYPLPNGELLPQIPLTVLATTNSSGIGRNWVKRRFIDKGVRGEIVKVPIEIFNPRTQEQEIIYRTQTHIFSSYKENTKLTPEYIAQLESIEDPVRRAQWLLGSWDNDGEGGRFDYIWESKVHVIEPFDIPKAWKIDRSFDYGSSAPFSVLWFAESDGCDIVLRNGKTRSTIKGDIFLIHEWAGCDPKDNNKGLRMLATDIAKGIIERELMWGIYDRCVAGNADNAIWNVDNGNCIASDMQKPVTIGNKVYQGVTWTRSDKSSGSRVAGWERIAEYLVNAKVTDAKPFREKAGLFIFNVCDNLIEVFPYLQRDDKNPDDIETKRQNDHCADALRYKIYGLKTGSRSGKTKGI